MRIEDLNIGDFGCFFDSRLQGIENGLNVIAGPQRAGKTTFMEVIRRLGYGIGRGEDLPPPSDRYAIRATVHHEGYEYSIELDHFADPRVTAIGDGAPDRSARELFGDVRKEQYRQLYTISLDELRREPDSLDNGIDLSRVLLGAGYGEASDLPNLVEALSEEAHAIGRTTGLQGGPIRESIELIDEGIEAKDAAVAQVDEFEEKQAELAAVHERILEISRAINQLDDEETRLEVLRSEFDDYERLIELRDQLDDADLEPLETFPIDDLERVRTLAEQYESARQTFRTERTDFAASVNSGDPEAYRERLLSEQDSIERFQNQLARYRSDVERLEQEADDLEREWESLNERISNLHPQWETVDDVSEIETDLFTQSGVRERSRSFLEADQRVNDLNERIDTRSGQIDHLGGRIDTATEGRESGISQGRIGWTLLGVLISVGLGVLLAIQNLPLIGIAVTSLLLIGIGVWLFRDIAPSSATHDGVNVEHLRAQQQEYESEISSLQDQLSEAQAQRSEARQDIEEVKEEYDLPDSIPPDAIGEFYDELVNVKDRIGNLEQRDQRFRDNREELEEELTGVTEHLIDIGVIEEAVENPLEESDRVFAAIERAADHLSNAQNVASSKRSVIEFEEDIFPYLDQWEDQNTPDPGDDSFPDSLTDFLDQGTDLEGIDRLREELTTLEASLTTQMEKGSVTSAFEPIREEMDAEEPPMVDVFDAVFQQYETIDAIDSRLESIEVERNEMEAEDTNTRDEQGRLESSLENLQSDDDVREAHQVIQEGQAKLEGRLESYAHYRIAQYLLDELHERYLNRTTGPLIERASEIFDRITDGAYEAIESTNEFEDLDFVANLSNGNSHASEELSRATAEQLFLAVRLAKIQLTEEPLPVLIDDSLTNFDPGHVHRTLEVLSEVGDDQQIFLLTCHPTMIDHVDIFHEAVYWSLDDGTFEGPSSSPEDSKALLERDSPLTYPDPSTDSS